MRVKNKTGFYLHWRNNVDALTLEIMEEAANLLYYTFLGIENEKTI